MEPEVSQTSLNLDKSAAFNQRLQRLDPTLKWEMDAKNSIGLRPEETWIRDELQRAKIVDLAGRRASMRRLFIQDALKIEAELEAREEGMIPTQP